MSETTHLSCNDIEHAYSSQVSGYRILDPRRHPKCLGHSYVKWLYSDLTERLRIGNGKHPRQLRTRTDCAIRLVSVWRGSIWISARPTKDPAKPPKCEQHDSRGNDH